MNTLPDFPPSMQAVHNNAAVPRRTVKPRSSQQFRFSEKPAHLAALAADRDDRGGKPLSGVIVCVRCNARFEAAFHRGILLLRLLCPACEEQRA